MSINKKHKIIQVVIGHICTIGFIILLVIPCICELSKINKFILILSGVLLFLFGAFCCLKIDSTFGTYKCINCGYEYTPSFKMVATSHHFNSKCFLKCPNCRVRCWHIKRID